MSKDNEEKEDLFGENHLASSFDTPLRADAFQRSDEQKMEIISSKFKEIMEKKSKEMMERYRGNGKGDGNEIRIEIGGQAFIQNKKTILIRSKPC